MAYRSASACNIHLRRGAVVCSCHVCNQYVASASQSVRFCYELAFWGAECRNRVNSCSVPLAGAAVCFNLQFSVSGLNACDPTYCQVVPSDFARHSLCTRDVLGFKLGFIRVVVN